MLTLNSCQTSLFDSIFNVGLQTACNACMQVAQDMVWVWADNGGDAGIESALTTPALIPELSDVEGIKSGRVIPGAVSQRDLAYGWDTFMENIMVSGCPMSSFGVLYSIRRNALSAPVIERATLSFRRVDFAFVCWDVCVRECSTRDRISHRGRCSACRVKHRCYSWLSLSDTNMYNWMREFCTRHF